MQYVLIAFCALSVVILIAATRVSSLSAREEEEREDG